LSHPRRETGDGNQSAGIASTEHTGRFGEPGLLELVGGDLAGERANLLRRDRLDAADIDR
jgi:hypothetical protein